MITRAKLSAVKAWGVRRLFEGGAYSSKYGMCIRCTNKIARYLVWDSFSAVLAKSF